MVAVPVPGGTRRHTSGRIENTNVSESALPPLPGPHRQTLAGVAARRPTSNLRLPGWPRVERQAIWERASKWQEKGFIVCANLIIIRCDAAFTPLRPTSSVGIGPIERSY